MNAVLNDRFEIATDNAQKGSGRTMFSKLAAKISNVSTLEKKDATVKMYDQNGKAEKEEVKQVETKTEVALAPAPVVVVEAPPVVVPVVAVEEAKPVVVEATTPAKSLDELLAELAQVDAQKASLEALIRDVRNASKAASIARLKEEMRKAGIEANELSDAPIHVQTRAYVPKAVKEEGAKRGPVEKKYYDPITGSYWSGRGRTPQAFLANPKDSYLIK